MERILNESEPIALSHVLSRMQPGLAYQPLPAIAGRTSVTHIVEKAVELERAGEEITIKKHNAVGKLRKDDMVGYESKSQLKPGQAMAD